jgi:hypothetical protein
MENSQEFRNVVASIKEVEQKLVALDESAQTSERYAVEAEAEIEGFFAKCVDVLAVRKASLLRELSMEISSQSMFLSLFFYMQINNINITKNELRRSRYVYPRSLWSFLYFLFFCHSTNNKGKRDRGAQEFESMSFTLSFLYSAKREQGLKYRKKEK